MDRVSAVLGPRSVVALSLVTVALVMAAALWTLGAVTPMRPLPLRVLLFGSALLAQITLPIGRGADLGRPVRLATGVGAGVCLLSSATFLLVFVYGPGRIATGGLTRAEPGAPQALRVVGFNVLHGYPRLSDPEGRAADLARALRHLEPDVVLLQETWCLARQSCLVDRLAEELGMTWAWTSANGSPLIGFEEGCAILSRFPLSEVERWSLRPRARPWRKRTALLAKLDLEARSLRLVCAHLESSPRVATEQARWLAGRLGALDSVLVGADLNLDGASDGVRALTEAGLVDVIPDGIDHVLLAEDAGWRVASAEVRLDAGEVSRVLGREVELSDHPALVVDLVREDR
jgi:endonuclease/exonuclease/phosphatase family metal-dependent hydrolase